MFGMAGGNYVRSTIGVSVCVAAALAVALFGLGSTSSGGVPDSPDLSTPAPLKNGKKHDKRKQKESETAAEDDTIRVSPDQVHQLTVVTVKELPFQARKPAIGQIAFNDDVSSPVWPQFPGRVLKVIAKVGDIVKVGDPLLEIDSPEILQPQNDFIAAVTALNKSKAQLLLAQTSEARQRLLFEGKATPLKEVQVAEAQLAIAENDLRSAETALDAARSKLRISGKSDDEIAALQKNGIVTRTSIVTAPVSGTVIARKVGPGQYVRTDTPDPLFMIADLSSMWLKAFVPETDAPAIKVGQDVEVTVLALPGRVFRARVIAIGAASDPNTHRVMVRSEIPNPDGVLKADMFASFRILTSDVALLPGVPIEAVIRHGDETVVWVQQEPLVFRRRLVKLGMEQDDRIEVLGGLKVGERILTRGAIFVDNEWRQ
jgi:cobalt-zinc-cadmium efflux system membrane fusion protein